MPGRQILSEEYIFRASGGKSCVSSTVFVSGRPNLTEEHSFSVMEFNSLLQRSIQLFRRSYNRLFLSQQLIVAEESRDGIFWLRIAILV